MARPIGWQVRDPELGKVKIEARFFGSTLTLYRQAGRHDLWKTFTPTDDDWDELERLARNKLQRGLITDKNMKLVLARGKKI